MKDGFDITELTNYEKKMIMLANEKMPKESKKFLKTEGGKLRKLTLQKAKQSVKKGQGNLFKGIKVGKVYIYKGNGGQSIRVYGGKPAYHMHLLEHGHRQVTEDGKEIGFVKGSHFFEAAAKEFEEQYHSDVQDFVDVIVEKGL
jgi:hypothetical protein